jgi:hypothetical protein
MAMTNSSVSATLFDQVTPGYVHIQKWAHPAAALALPDVHLKWTLIQPETLPITEDQVTEAQLFLAGEIKAGRLALKNEVGFVVQHRCAEVLILYVCTWRGDNEVWETLFHKRLAPGAQYGALERENTSPTFCVWVLPAVLHEQRAWVRYLQSGRDEAARRAYLDDQMTGWV